MFAGVTMTAIVHVYLLLSFWCRIRLNCRQVHIERIEVDGRPATFKHHDFLGKILPNSARQYVTNVYAYLAR